MNNLMRTVAMAALATFADTSLVQAKGGRMLIYYLSSFLLACLPIDTTSSLIPDANPAWIFPGW